jgi:uncharacterized protein
VPLDAVDLADDFWEPRRRINREVTMRSQYRHLEDTGRLDNFRRASAKIGGAYQGIYFNDSDVYKWLEAAAWTLAEGSDPELERMVDAAITEIEDAQGPDGYLNTYFTFERAAQRWTDFDLHEMYCAGHLFQAAVAHFRATGSERLLDVATRFADHICDTFGPEEGKRHAVDGHEEVEMALVELFRARGGISKGRGTLSTPADTGCSADLTGNTNRPTARTTSLSGTRARSSGTPSVLSICTPAPLTCTPKQESTISYGP